MSDLFLRVLNMSLTASIVIAAIIIIRLFLKKAPKVFSYALWLIVLVRLLCPITVSAPFSVMPGENTGLGISNWTDDYVSETVFVHDIHPEYQAAVDKGIEPVYAGDGGYYVVTAPDGSEPETVKTAVIPKWSVIWIFGMVSMALWGIVSFIRLKMRLVGEVCLQNNVYIADHISSPFVLGVLRPKIYLPSALGADEREYIMLHEQHHIRRLDHIIKLLAFLALCVHWFNPLVWVAFVLSSKDMEMSCDEAVMKKMDRDIRAEYSVSLLKFAADRKVIIGTPVAFGESSTKERVKNVMSYKKPAVWMIVAAVVVCIVSAACLATDPKENADPFSKSYVAESIEYANGMYSYVLTEENSPNYMFRLETDGKLIAISKDNLTGKIYGRAKTLKLTTENFDALFLNEREYGEKLRQNNKAAWIVRNVSTGNNVFYHILKQKNGEVYITYGYQHTDTPHIRFVFKLKETEVDITDYSIIDGEIYVTNKCIFMHTLSSFLPFDGDSGYAYKIAEDSLVVWNRQTGEVSVVSSLQTWRELPYTKDEWEKLMKEASLNFEYDKTHYLPVMGGTGIIESKGELWLIEIRENAQMGKFVWSVYSLVQENAMGSARWEFYPTFSSREPRFRFDFDMDFSEITVVCTGGGSVSDSTWQRDTSVVIKKGEPLYWYPYSGDGLEVATRAKISFSVDDKKAGGIYITGEKTENGWLYTAKPTGMDIIMFEGGEYGGAVIYG